MSTSSKSQEVSPLAGTPPLGLSPAGTRTWPKVKPETQIPGIFKDVAWHAGAFLHGFQPSLLEPGLDRLDAELQWHRPLPARRAPTPPAAQLKSLDCEPLEVQVPRLEVEDLGWHQLPKQPPGDGAPSDLQITADLGDLSDQRLNAVSCLVEWVQF